jgi:hypothetical protein
LDGTGRRRRKKTSTGSRKSPERPAPLGPWPPTAPTSQTAAQQAQCRHGSHVSSGRHGSHASSGRHGSHTSSGRRGRARPACCSLASCQNPLPPPMFGPKLYLRRLRSSASSSVLVCPSPYQPGNIPVQKRPHQSPSPADPVYHDLDQHIHPQSSFQAAASRASSPRTQATDSNQDSETQGTRRWIDD